MTHRAYLISVELNDIIENDHEHILDILSERSTGSELLSYISYRIAGCDEYDLHLLVEGDDDYLQYCLDLDAEDTEFEDLEDETRPDAVDYWMDNVPSAVVFGHHNMPDGIDLQKWFGKLTVLIFIPSDADGKPITVESNLYHHWQTLIRGVTTDYTFTTEKELGVQLTSNGDHALCVACAHWFESYPEKTVPQKETPA